MTATVIDRTACQLQSPSARDAMRAFPGVSLVSVEGVVGYGNASQCDCWGNCRWDGIGLGDGQAQITACAEGAANYLLEQLQAHQENKKGR